MIIKSNNKQFLQWNCRSIWSNLPSFEHFIKTNNYSVLALQSLNIEKRKMPQLESYYYPPICDCKNNDDKVKAAIYIRDDLKCSVLSDLPKIPFESIYFAGARVMINEQYAINFVSVYLPSGPKDFNTDWIKDPNFINIQKDHWCILGDFNAHDRLWDNGRINSDCNRLVENIMDSNLIILNDGDITRIPDRSDHRPSAIDISLMSPNLAILCSWNILDDCLGSDHLPISIEMNAKNNNSNISEDKVPKFKYHLARWDVFREFLSSFDTKEISDNTDVNQSYEKFQNIVLEAANKAIPKVKNVKGKKKGNVWWTDECQIAVNQKKETFKVWKKNQIPDNFVNMKRSKVKCNRIIAKAKKAYWTYFCENEILDSTDSVKVWKKVKAMKNKFHLPIYPIHVDNDKIPSSLKKAHVFNDFFTNNSLSTNLDYDSFQYRKNEEKKKEFSEPKPDQSHYLNANITFIEFDRALKHFSTNNTSVGLDGISFQMLSKLPYSFKQVLFSLFQKFWVNETLPNIWKSSVIVPVPKEGKPRSHVNSYRPIALTSHVCKLFEKIVLTRLVYHCDKHNILPHNQCGFRKGRSTTDHMVKLTNHIKRQFSKRKSTLATFFDVKKAYDTVWHAKLLYKLNNIGISGHMYRYIKEFISNRCISTRIENVYSSEKIIDQGIPQGSLIAPLLFSILISDLPTVVSKYTNVVQYADDVAIWLNCNLRKNTKNRTVKYIETIYQRDINAINNYMKLNGLQLSSEKTLLILFNNGQNSTVLPKLTLNNESLRYEQSVKFLGVHFTRNLSWKMHINHLITKARKNLNLLKIICSQPWGQDSKTLIHLANALVRSRLTYGQETFFAAPKYLLGKIQSIDSRAFKLALGISVSSNTLRAYNEVGILPLNKYRVSALSKYIIRYLSITNNEKEHIFFTSQQYPKRAQNIAYLKTILDVTKETFSDCHIDIKDIKEVPMYSPLPPWEQHMASFDCDNNSLSKKDDLISIVNNVKINLDTNYMNHLKIYTDGSVLDNLDCGAGFVIPDLKIERAFYVGNRFSIFTCELFAIIMALNFICESNLDIFSILMCVDSKSVLHAIQNLESKIRRDLLFEVRFLIHILKNRGIGVNFIWIPSHSGLYWNNIADSLAKNGAKKTNTLDINYNMTLGPCEIKSLIQKYMRDTMNLRKYTRLNCPRYITCIVHKIRLNTWKTKFVKDCICPCTKTVSIDHILFECMILRNQGLDLSSFSKKDILINIPLLIDIAKAISKSALAKIF